MSLRDEFEKLFPVPETLELVGDFYHLKPDFDHWVNVPTEAEYNAKWQGFQAGHAAGLEKGLDMAGNKAVETGWYVAAEEIRAMKEQKSGQEDVMSEPITAGHPCFDPDGPPDHDWQYVDHSFSHEFGTEICGHYECTRCDAIKPD